LDKKKHNYEWMHVCMIYAKGTEKTWWG